MEMALGLQEFVVKCVKVREESPRNEFWEVGLGIDFKKEFWSHMFILPKIEGPFFWDLTPLGNKKLEGMEITSYLILKAHFREAIFLTLTYNILLFLFIIINKQVHFNIYSLLCCMKYLCNASMYCTKIPIFSKNIMWCSPQSLQKRRE